MLLLLMACDGAPDDTGTKESQGTGDSDTPPSGHNLCGEIVRHDGAPEADYVSVLSIIDGKTPCTEDTGAGRWWDAEVANATPVGDAFSAAVPLGSFGVEVLSGGGDYSGCTPVDVTDTTDCASEIVVDVYESISVDKPNLYLYPPAPTDVQVRIPASRYLTASDPIYPADGWKVRAFPNGALHTPVGGRDFLFYEISYDPHRFQTHMGWCVAGPQGQASIEDAMADLGFLPNEIADFSEAWDGVFPTDTPVTVYPQWDDLTQLRIEPAPDNLLRVWFYVEFACNPVEPVAWPSLPPRSGYHAAEWGVAFGIAPGQPEVLVEGGW